MTENKKEGTKRRTISEFLFGKKPVPVRKPQSRIEREKKRNEHR